MPRPIGTFATWPRVYRYSEEVRGCSKGLAGWPVIYVYPAMVVDNMGPPRSEMEAGKLPGYVSVAWVLLIPTGQRVRGSTRPSVCMVSSASETSVGCVRSDAKEPAVD
jgi:hypothetical protein